MWFMLMAASIDIPPMLDSIAVGAMNVDGFAII
jgi:hypothetical protein